VHVNFSRVNTRGLENINTSMIFLKKVSLANSRLFGRGSLFL
jgi:hypothetical protein